MQLTALHRGPLGLRPADRTAIPSYRQTRQRRKPCPLHDRFPGAVVSDLLSRLESLEVTAENGKIFDQPCWIWFCFAKSALISSLSSKYNF
jgi:hypothetical protein